MVRFINKQTKTLMLVADDRKDEYLAAGHILAASHAEKPKTEAKVEAAEVENTEAKPVKKKAVTKKR